MTEHFELSAHKGAPQIDWESFSVNASNIESNRSSCQSEDPHPANDRDCLNSAKTAWDHQLNAVYQGLMKEVTPQTTGKLLQETQREWIKFQQSEQKVIDKLLNTDDANVLIARAKMQLHQDRAQELLGMRIDFPSLGDRADACINNSTGTKSMNACITERLDEAEKSLNNTYNALRNHLTPQDKEMLKSSQLQWLSFRTKDNSFINSYNPLPGGMLSRDGAYAKLNVTEHRTKQLQFLLTNLQPQSR